MLPDTLTAGSNTYTRVEAGSSATETAYENTVLYGVGFPVQISVKHTKKTGSRRSLMSFATPILLGGSPTSDRLVLNFTLAYPIKSGYELGDAQSLALTDLLKIIAASGTGASTNCNLWANGSY